jgi:hypothetical protein
MPWTARASLSVVLAVACALLPLVLDHCAVSCEAHSPAASTSAPGCHHAASIAMRVRAMPAPCGHDHHGPAASLTVAPSPAPRTLFAAPAVSVDPLVATDSIARRFDAGDAISPPAFPAQTLALPLRL